MLFLLGILNRLATSCPCRAQWIYKLIDSYSFWGIERSGTESQTIIEDKRLLI